MATKFQVGDRVVYHLNSAGRGDSRMIGYLGTIKEVRDQDTFEVEFDKEVRHFTSYSSARHSKEKHGWVTRVDRLSKVILSRDDALAALVNRQISDEKYKELTKDGS